MAYADKCYVGKRVTLELLSTDDIRQIHEATLDVFENVGVKYHSQTALEILEANGATVDRETNVAKVPAAVVEKALSRSAGATVSDFATMMRAALLTRTSIRPKCAITLRTISLADVSSQRSMAITSG